MIYEFSPKNIVEQEETKNSDFELSNFTFSILTGSERKKRVKTPKTPIQVFLASFLTTFENRNGNGLIPHLLHNCRKYYLSESLSSPQLHHGSSNRRHLQLLA